MVLGILGFLVIVMVLYLVFNYLNTFSLRRYSYEFFSLAHMFQIIVGYWIIYFGNSLYTKALSKGGDLLNGQLLIFIGVVVIFLIIYKNFKAVPFLVAFIFTILELLICAPLAGGVLLALLILVGVLSETKPVYVLNND